MILSKIVAHCKDGTTIKGMTSNFSPNVSFFNLELNSGKEVRVDMDKLKTVEINLEELKAAFFVKEFGGNQDRKDEYNDVIAGGGKKIEVKFTDGEVITGYALSYSSDRDCFFITPADLQSNNERILIIRSATEKITFL